MANLYKLAPQFIEEGRLCWLRSPLWIVKEGKTESYYFTDAEMDEARKTIPSKAEIQRNKGLGSLTVEQAARSMFSASHQRLDVIKSSPTALELLEALMGEDIEPRREYVFNNIDFSTIRE
jgi:DNA gyrase subunit B